MRIIGIAGPSGAGKTTLCHYLATSFKEDFEHVRQDDYLKNPDVFPMLGKFKNWEAPSNYKFDVLAEHLLKLRHGEKVDNKTFAADDSRVDYVLEPKKYILLEGSLILTNEAIRNLVDLKIYLDVPPDVMIERRAKRAENTGMDLTEYDKKVTVPEFEKHGRVQKFYADFIVDATKSKREVADEVKGKITSAIKTNENKSTNTPHLGGVWN